MRKKVNDGALDFFLFLTFNNIRSSWSVILGFPVMGIWPDFSDGTDVNSITTNSTQKYVATADDFGGVKLFNFPCVVEDAPFIRKKGHSSHVSGVEFLRGDKR